MCQSTASIHNERMRKAASAAAAADGNDDDNNRQRQGQGQRQPLSAASSSHNSRADADAQVADDSAVDSSAFIRNQHSHHHCHDHAHPHNNMHTTSSPPWMAFIFLAFATLLVQPYILGDGAAAIIAPSSLSSSSFSSSPCADNAANSSSRDTGARLLRGLFGMNRKKGNGAPGQPAKTDRDAGGLQNIMFGIINKKDGKATPSDMISEEQPKNTDTISSNAVSIERGKPISSKVTGEELYEAYKEIREEYKTRAMSSEYAKRWDVLKKTNDGIAISMLQHPSDPNCPYVRMTATMPGDIEDVWNFLELDSWEQTMPKMDPFYDGLSILGKYTHRPSPGRPAVSMVLAKKRTKRIVMYGKRDFTFVSVSDAQSGGVWVSGTVSIVTPKFPREKGYVRAFQDSVAFYEAMPDDVKTGEPRSRLTIVCRIDLNDSAEGGKGGAIPMWFYVKTIGSSGALSMNNMRSELRKRVAEKLVAARERKALQGQRRVLDERACPLIPWVGISPAGV